MKKRTKYIVLIIFLISLIIPIAISFNKETKTSNEQIKYSESQNEYVVFEAVGNYAFATAGNNNADRGTSVNSLDYTWIQSFPESDKVSYNWETVKEQILTETGLTEITNMSGSYLNIDGAVQKALLSAVISKSNGTGYQGRVLLLKPDGSYDILNFNTNYWMTVVDITEYLIDVPKGWFYISYLDAAPIPQSGWTIAAVYENETIEKNYIKMLNVNQTIRNGGQMSVMFDSKFKLQNNFQLMGVVMLAGSNGFQVLNPTSSQSTLDRAFAILDDDTEFQLYDRGDGHFTGRTDIDFANGIYGAQRSHNIQGGELDIFDERLNSSYFGGKNIVGYRFIKDGKDQVNISTLGLSQSIVDSNLSVKTEITAATKFQENSSISIKSTINNNLKDGYCYNSYNNVITNSVDNSLSNITNIKAYLNGTTALNATYDSTSRKIVIEEIKELTCSDEIILTFDATVNSNIENSIKNNKYTISSVINNNYSLIDLSELTGDELTKYESLKANEEATDTVTSPRVYKVTINHYQNGTTTKLADSTTMKLFDGESYTSSSVSSLLTNYNVTIPSNASGTATGNITVNYYYTLKQATITIKYLEEDTNKILSTQETKTLNYTDSYSYTAKDITNYEFSGTSKTVSGTVAGDKEIIFYYKLKTATLTVHHYIEGTTTKLVESQVSTVYWGNTYNTSKSSSISSDYEYSTTQGTPSGTIAGDVTVIYYYKLKTATITVHHYIEGTTTKLAEDVITTQKYTTDYNTKTATVDSNYELVSTPNNASGKVAGDIIVTYYYKLKTATITVHHYIEGTTTKLSEDVITTQKYTTDYNTKTATVDSNYELVSTPSNASGKVAGDIIVTYYYKLKTATITVHHYIEGTTTKLAEDVITTQKYTTDYNTKAAVVNTNYELVSTPSNASGKVAGDIIVTYYYKLKTATITVHHYIEGTTTKLADDVITTQKYTTDYNTKAATVDSNYELVSTPDNASGKVTGDIIVTYYYKLKEATLTINHYIEGTTTKLSQTITKNVYWGETYTTSAATDINKNYKLVVTPTNATGTIAGNVTVNYYYSLKEATLTVHYYIEGTTSKLSESIIKSVNWGETYTTSEATDINKNYELVSTPSNATGTIEGDTIVIYYYKLKEATLTVHHYIEGTTNELANTTVKSVHWGDTYTTNIAQVDSNYELVSTPNNATGTIAGNVVVTYYYKLKTATITVHHYIEGTTTKLAEDVVTTQKYTTSYTTEPATVNKNYELIEIPENGSGKVSGDVIVTYYYKLKEATLTVNHYIEGTKTSLSSTTTETVYWGETYTTNPATVDSNYEYSSVSGNTTGTVSGNITVTYYYKKKTSTLTVHHYIDGTTTKLADDQISTVYYGDTYTTDIHENIPDNYELKSKTTNYTGIISSKNIEVIYYYQKKDSSLETTITKTGPEEITKKDEAVEYKITYTAKVTDYIGEGTITIVDTLPYKINIELSNLDEGTYNEDTNTITWAIPWTDIDSFNNKGETTIEKNISLVYSDILPTERIMINSVKGTISLDNNSREIESQTSTNIKIPGKITIHYYLKDTEIPVKDSIEEIDLVGETYISSAEELEGYILTKPETEEYTFTEEEQIVIYYYERVKVHIKTEVNGNGGTIIGDEDINYGDDSTKDKIVIKPNEGYVLGDVIINGEKIELTEKDKEGLILDNFHELKEDVTITVTFIKKTEENPETGSFISYLVLIAIPLSIGIIKYIKNKKEFIKL